jgi:hypothetical protein
MIRAALRDPPSAEPAQAIEDRPIAPQTHTAVGGDSAAVLFDGTPGRVSNCLCVLRLAPKLERAPCPAVEFPLLPRGFFYVRRRLLFRIVRLRHHYAGRIT